ncbi:MAG: hypothetical protein EGQ09_18760 [Clostridiales bacterium]|nr:hypothetical protein [Clostridiales bacterium]
MAFQITEQLRTFGWAILLGLAAGLLYDLLRAIRLRRPRMTWALDLLYCLAAGAALSLFVLRQGDGQLRSYILLGALGGGVVFFSLFSAPLRPLWDFWLDRCAEFFRLLVWPLRKGSAICKKIVRQTKNLFYFCEKYATIGIRIHRRPHYKGGRPHGKGNCQARKKKIRRPVDPRGDPPASGRHRLAAVPSAKPDRQHPGGEGPHRSAGGNAETNQRRAAR